MTKLILVRHGETKENVLDIIQGQNNSKLTKKGFLQAKRIAFRLKKEHIDAAYSSDLERCVNTAKEILKYHPHLKLILSSQLREQKKGVYEGRPSPIMHKAVKESGNDWYKFKPEGGETMGRVQQRAKLFFTKLIAAHKNKTVLVVTHGGPLVSLYLLLFKKGFEEYGKYQPENAAVTILEIESLHKHKVQILNCSQHLK